MTQPRSVGMMVGRLPVGKCLKYQPASPQQLADKPSRSAAFCSGRGKPVARRWLSATIVVGLILLPPQPLLPPQAANAGQVALTIGPSSTSLISPQSAGTWMINWTFTPTAPLVVTHLGWIDAPQPDEGSTEWGDGLAWPHQVGIWQWQVYSAIGVPLAAATIPAGDSAELIDRFRYVRIDPLMLSAGTTYVIGGESVVVSGAPRDWAIHNPLPNLPGLVEFGMRWHQPANGFGTPHLEGADFNRAIAANFRFVPEPSTLALLALGGGIVLTIRWRNVECHELTG